MRVHTTLILTGLYLLIGSLSDLHGQSTKSCGHDHAQGQLFDSPEAFEKAKAEVLKGAYSKYLKKSGEKNNSVMTIPVVFHIIHSGETEGVGSNLPAGRVQAQLDVLNEDFSASNANFSDVTRPAWDAVKGNPLLSFCLATADPDGNSTTGIVRHDIAITGADANNNNIEDVKADIYWDSDKYMNVYVLSIPGTTASGGVVGYAYLPYFGTVGGPQDGIVVDYNWFGGDGYPQSGAKTLTHEVGHYLGLFHTFNGSSCGDDDGLSDTPNMSDATSSLTGSLSCGNPMNPYPSGPESCGDEHMYINYMDYVNDEDCPTSFTLDQVAIMRGVLEGTAPLFTTRAPLVANTNTACNGATGCDLSASTSHTNTTCVGDQDGTATVTASAGTPPYSHIWNTSPVQTTASATGLSAGTYFVTTTDSDGCTVVNTSVVETGSELVVNVSATDETTLGAENGTITATPSGGTPGYTYQWDNGLAMASSYSNLSPGTYNVTVTDNLGCTATGSGTVNEGPCPDLDVSASTQDVSCNGGSDGYGNISVSTGVAPFTYRWNGVTFGNERFNLSASFYTVVVTDSEGCTGSFSFTIDEPSSLSASMSTTGLTAVNQDDGTATVNVTGGSPSYSYAWSNSGGNVSSLNNLSPGDYTVTVTDANNCQTTVTGNVADYECDDFDITLSGGDLYCPGDASLLSVSNISSMGPYSYSWSTGATTDAITVTAAGTYSVSILDVNGCVSSTSTVIEAAPPALGLAFTAFAETATNANDGRIETQVTGGMPPYSYAWSNGQTIANMDDLAPGNYTLTVTDANNCSETGTTSIPEFTCSSLNIASTKLDVSCFGVADGGIDITSDGLLPFSYNWSNGALTQDINNLVAGTYTISLTDANGCTGNASISILEPAQIIIGIEKSDESSEGANDGQITTSVSGGSLGYTYLWSDGSTTANRSSLEPGSYTLTVTDNTLCTNTTTVTIADYSCSEIELTSGVTDILCAGDSSGIISLNIQQITSPYTLVWNNGSDEEQLTGLVAGNYSVTLTDGGACDFVREYEITEPSQLVAPATSTAETFNDGNDGGAVATVSGGQGPYTYSWSNNAVTSTIDDLEPGLYVVTVSDANGCTIITEVEVSAYVCPQFEIAGVNKTNNVCADGTEGTLGASILGGTAPYTFEWSNGATNAVIDGLAEGSYTVIVTDAKNCTVTASETLEDPDQLEVSISLSHVSSVGASDGSISLDAQGGTAPYTYQWDTNSTNEAIDNLAEGTYGYTVTDSNGCTDSGEIVIEQYVCPNLSIAFEVGHISCLGENDGALSATANGGTAPYIYSWSLGATSNPQIASLTPGTYEVTATDERGCTVVASETITEPASLESSTTISHESRGNANDGSVEINISGGTAPYEVTWTDGVTGLTRSDMAPGEYSYAILDFNRCVNTGQVTIDAYNCTVIELMVSVFDNECEDGDVGGVDVEVMNSNGPFNYYIDGSIVEGPSIRGLQAGSYELMVEDSEGCTALFAFEVESPMPMVVDAVITEDAFGNLPGSASVTVLGGAEPYTYLWSNDRTNATNNALFPGIHYVSITDEIGCVIIQEVVIHQIEEVHMIENLLLFETHPNPADDMVAIQVEFSSPTDIRVVINNISGQPVFDEVINAEVYNRQVDISNLPKGLYKINIYSDEEVITKTLAIF